MVRHHFDVSPRSKNEDIKLFISLKTVSLFSTLHLILLTFCNKSTIRYTTQQTYSQWLTRTPSPLPRLVIRCHSLAWPNFISIERGADHIRLARLMPTRSRSTRVRHRSLKEQRLSPPTRHILARPSLRTCPSRREPRRRDKPRPRS